MFTNSCCKPQSPIKFTRKRTEFTDKRHLVSAAIDVPSPRRRLECDAAISFHSCLPSRRLVQPVSEGRFTDFMFVVFSRH